MWSAYSAVSHSGGIAKNEVENWILRPFAAFRIAAPNRRSIPAVGCISHLNPILIPIRIILWINSQLKQTAETTN